MPPVYNPIVKNGKFRVVLGDKSFVFSAVDAAEAKWKFAAKFGIDFNENVAKMAAEVISPPIRKYDRPK